MSFHAYLRKMTSGKFITLDELSCKIKPGEAAIGWREVVALGWVGDVELYYSSGCKEHPPWPRGICSSCQPGAVTLTRQPYRHVDNVLLEHAAPVERFLSYWRATGHQRVGFLYGRYELHPDVPLGALSLLSRNEYLAPVHCPPLTPLPRRYSRPRGRRLRAASGVQPGRRPPGVGRPRRAPRPPCRPSRPRACRLDLHRPAAVGSSQRHGAVSEVLKHTHTNTHTLIVPHSLTGSFSPQGCGHALPLRSGMYHGRTFPERASERV